jgi:hypothetical protein
LSYCTMRMPPCRAPCCTFKPQWTGSWNRNKYLNRLSDYLFVLARKLSQDLSWGS